jgi:hypothetical protein
MPVTQFLWQHARADITKQKNSGVSKDQSRLTSLWINGLICFACSYGGIVFRRSTRVDMTSLGHDLRLPLPRPCSTRPYCDDIAGSQGKELARVGNKCHSIWWRACYTGTAITARCLGVSVDIRACPSECLSCHRKRHKERRKVGRRPM